MRKAWLALAMACAAAPLTSGCAIVAVGAVAQAGVIGLQDRTLGRAIDDANASNVAKAKLMAVSTKTFSKVDIEVADGKMLLSGVVPADQDRLEAERIAWSVQGV
ncbi:MAG: BON domain-containing protein, partial [Hyphomonadaceae bacterium]